MRSIKVTASVFFTLAILAAIIRLTVRLKLQRRLFLDDGLLICACFCLIVSTVLSYNLLDIWYINEALAIDPDSVNKTSSKAENRHLDLRMWHAANPMLWTSLYLVKFSFLHFFKSLVSRIDGMKMYWNAVIVICVLSYFTSISETFIACPHFNSDRKQPASPITLSSF